jgi:N-acetylglucosaminyl-diphospho-decaprenol L-rhamnosyltransferase
MPKVSIIILDFLKSKRVIKNVASIQKQCVNFPIEIIILDNSNNAKNAQKLRTLKRFKNVRLIFNQKNLGYTRGNNHGVKKSQGEFIFIVNPDIVWIDKNTISKLINFLESHPQVGVVGPQQVNNSDGKIAMNVRAFPKLLNQIARRTWLRNLPILRQRVAYDEMQHLNYKKTQPVDWLQSSFWVVRKKLWDELSGLDERFFIFMSDPDFCRRVWESGKEVVYFPEVKVSADGLRCSVGGFFTFCRSWVLRQHLRDALRYYWKYFGKDEVRKV